MVKKVQERKKDNSIIFITTLVALFVVAMVGFNIEEISGQAIGFGKTTVTVNPKIINAGERIEINVVPGKGCVNRWIGIYDDSDSKKATIQTREFSGLMLCKPFKAFYQISNTWKPKEDETGIFFVKVFDYNRNEFVKTAFTIRGE